MDGPIKSDDPIASDPELLWVWTRYVGILIAILAFTVGYGEVSLPPMGG